MRATWPGARHDGLAPLHGKRVLELGTMIAAPFATHILSQLGAEVIKIEPPAGDTTRALVRGGPSGTIGTNKPDGFAIDERIAEDIAAGALPGGSRKGRAGFEALAEERGLKVVTFRDWKKIEEAEASRARDGAPREKFVDIDEMIHALD